MFTLNEWYIFQEGFDKEACNKIISLGGDGFDTAKVGERAYDNPGLNKDVRVSDVKWLKDSRWIIDLVTPYIEYANINSEWKFDVRGVSRLQLTRYEVGFTIGIGIVLGITQ